MTARTATPRASGRPRRDWHFAASHTHLYPGAMLRLRTDAAADDDDRSARPRRGDTLRIEFADLGFALGRVAAARTDGFDAAMHAHTTARGTLVAERTWRVVYAGEAGPAAGCTVRQRLDAR